MKKLTIPFLSMLLALAILAPGCKKDKEADREKFLAVYSMVESCPSGNSNYDMTIAASASGDNAVVITNFGDFFGVSITGTVSGNNLSIPQQNVTVQSLAVGVSGSGTLNGNSLAITYTYTVLGQAETCSMTCTKK